MPTADDWIDQGLDAHQAGRVDDAAAAYAQALALEPDHPDALNLLGVLRHQAGDHAAAVGLIARATLADPTTADFHANLGEAQRGLGAIAPAINAYAKSCEIDGTNAPVWANLAALLTRTQRAAEAVGAWKHAIELDPQSAEYWNNYGLSLVRAGRAAEAIEPLERALALRPAFVAAIENLAEAYGLAGRPRDGQTAARRLPDVRPDDAAAWVFYAAACNDADRPHDALDAAKKAIGLDAGHAQAHFVLGQALAKMGEQAGAAVAYAKVTELRPDLAGGFANLGLAAMSTGNLEAAVDALTEATDLLPDYPEAWFNLAVVHERRGEHAKAIGFAEKARALRPAWAAVSSMIGNLRLHLGQHEEAEADFRLALSHDPKFVPAVAGLGNVHGERGEQAEAGEHLRRAVAINPKDATAHSTLLMSMVAGGEFTPDAVFEQHRAFGRQFDTPPVAFANAKVPDRRIKLGYLSPDLRAHSVAFFLAGVFQHHDHANVELIAYDDTPKPDVVSQLLRSYCDRWHRVVGMSNDRLLDLIREHEIDILVDLAGHTSGNRLPMFAKRAAPVQASYLGYPATSGLTAMDYRFTDALADPPGLTDAHHTETLVRLPGSFLAYAAPPFAPDVGPLPAVANGYVTFASFNNTTKLHPGVYALWARVLHAVSGSRLILKANGLADATLRGRIVRQFETDGIDPARVELRPKTAMMADHLAVYNRCDLALDSFPYTGTTTTCEAMWMGVPTVTLAGRVHSGRVGVSLLTNAGLPDWVAESPDAYVATAVRHARDLPRLAGLRAGLRERMRASPVMDARTLAGHLDAAYRTVWRDYCRAT